MSRMSPTRVGAAAVAFGIASFVASGTAQPAFAITPPHPVVVPIAPPVGARSVHPMMKGSTPMCLVGAALLYPFFIGGVLLGDPASLPSALPGYWVGGTAPDHKADDGNDFHGRLAACGLDGAS